MKKAIAILSAGIKKNKDGQWASTDLSKSDNKLGAPGGKMRVIAASYLFKDNPETAIIASGGRGWDVVGDEPDRPNLSAIIKHELVELGVLPEKIIEENNSNKTMEQLKEIAKTADRKGINHVIIITNDYHLARVKAMIEFNDSLNEMFKNNQINLKSAEKICLQYDQEKWQNTINDAYESEEMKKRIKMEKNGVKQIKEGTYKF